MQSRLRYSLVIFDLDGTLADSFPWFQRHVNGVADLCAFRRIEDEDIEDLLGGRDYVALDCAGQVVRPIDYREYLFVPREQLDTARARLASDPR